MYAAGLKFVKNTGFKDRRTFIVFPIRPMRCMRVISDILQLFCIFCDFRIPCFVKLTIDS